jgi:hypothetical protein
MGNVQPLCLETFSSAGLLGRFVITDRRLTIGVGVVKDAEWDTSTAHIPCRVARPDWQAIRIRREEARRAKRAAKQNRWVGVLRGMPKQALKITGT